MFLGLPAPLFTIDLDTEMGRGISRHAFQRFFDCLEPAFGLQVTLGQVNTVVVCPALTSHSELSDAALREAGISPTTIRISVGDEDPRSLLAHLMQAAELALEPECPGFSRISRRRTRSTRCTSRPMWTCTGATRPAGRACGRCCGQRLMPAATVRRETNVSGVGPQRPEHPLAEHA